MVSVVVKNFRLAKYDKPDTGIKVNFDMDIEDSSLIANVISMQVKTAVPL